MEDRWFLLIRDTVGIAGNLAECIGVVFLFTQFRRRARTIVVKNHQRAVEEQ